VGVNLVANPLAEVDNVDIEFIAVGQQGLSINGDEIMPTSAINK